MSEDDTIQRLVFITSRQECITAIFVDQNTMVFNTMRALKLKCVFIDFVKLGGFFNEFGERRQLQREPPFSRQPALQLPEEAELPFSG